MHVDVKKTLTKLNIDEGLTKTARDTYNETRSLTHDKTMDKFLEAVTGSLIQSGNSGNESALSKELMADYVWCEFTLDGHEYLYVVVGANGCGPRSINGDPTVVRATHDDLTSLVFGLDE